MVVFRFSQYGPVLVTRALGAEVREALLKELATAPRVVLDFDGVEMIGNSFADECLGKLLLGMSLEELKRCTTFRNLTGTSRVSVSAALRRRYNAMTSTASQSA